jgi:putative flavoprotein involved in K+ transport
MRGKKCWTLLTTLQELKGFEEKRDPSENISSLQDPYVAIVGGGQGGIGLAARLKRLGVPAVILERNERAGDSWRKRYKTLCLHDPVWYDHMPYLPFPDHWPVFSPKDRIADWLEMYVKVMQLDYRAGTEVLGCSFENNLWSINTSKGPLQATHLVLATGMSGFPSVPQVPSTFQGEAVHSSRFRGEGDYKGKKAVVVGAGTSAHDIAAMLYQAGADVTMVQRAPSIVVTSEALQELAWGPLYSEQAVRSGITTALADLTVAATPFKLLPGFQKPIYEKIRQRDATLYAGLEKAGFLFDMGEDGSGIHSLYLRRGAGYYIEVGASQMIIDGHINLRSKVSVQGLSDGGVVLSDQSQLPADLVVWATGYGSMNQWAEKLISKEVADQAGKVWGLGSGTRGDPGPWVGELRNMWKPTQVPNLWFHGGNLMQSRHYSLYLGLQLKARLEKIPTPVFFIDPVHHQR